MRRIRNALPAITAALVLVPIAIVGPPALADEGDSGTDPDVGTGGIEVRADGFIDYGSLLVAADVDATEIHVQGQRDANGGCEFHSEATGGPDGSLDTSPYIEEVAYNPATCEAEFLAADLTPEQASEILGDDAEAAGGRAPGANRIGRSRVQQFGQADGGGGGSAGAWARSIRTRWIDPVDITITEQTLALKWNGTSVVNHGVTRNSFKGCVRGVCLDQTNITSSSQNLLGGSNYWQKVGTVNFRNNSFAKWIAGITTAYGMSLAGWAACGFPTDWSATFHHHSDVYGYKSGAWKVVWDDAKDGACTDLVHHDTYHPPSFLL